MIWLRNGKLCLWLVWKRNQRAARKLNEQLGGWCNHPFSPGSSLNWRVVVKGVRNDHIWDTHWVLSPAYSFFLSPWLKALCGWGMFYFSLCFQHLGPWLAHSRCSIHTCWMNGWANGSAGLVISKVNLWKEIEPHSQKLPGTPVALGSPWLLMACYADEGLCLLSLDWAAGVGVSLSWALSGICRDIKPRGIHLWRVI